MFPVVELTILEREKNYVYVKNRWKKWNSFKNPIEKEKNKILTCIFIHKVVMFRDTVTLFYLLAIL